MNLYFTPSSYFTHSDRILSLQFTSVSSLNIKIMVGLFVKWAKERHFLNISNKEGCSPVHYKVVG